MSTGIVHEFKIVHMSLISMIGSINIDELRVFILFLVRFGLLSGHLLGNSCSITLCMLTICNFSYFPFWF